jgi:hypothetical protein
MNETSPFFIYNAAFGKGVCKMNLTERAIALVLVLSWGFFGCEDNGHPLRPSPDAERYPNTTVLFGVNHYHTQQYGPMVSDTIRFDDGEPDTLPYNSLLTLYYYGCADERDKADYTDPQVEMRYQFHFCRRGVSIDGDHTSMYITPW